jgi:uncharacterized surface protein with fasciclin (FAS1) repeats
MNKKLLVLPVLALTLAACSPSAPESNTNITDQAATQTNNEPVQAGSTETMQGDTTMNTIVDTAIANGNFTTLVKAVTAAGLGETLSGDGPFTVFAPTDEAFAKVPKATLDSLLADPKALAEVLTYHVVSGKVMASDVANLTSATTVQGADVTIDTSNGVMINNAKVITADVEASNGVIHVIDTVLLPPTN